MFADPQSVTINAVPKSMPRIKQGQTDCTYSTADGEFKLRISHQATKTRTRRMVRLDQTVIAADPLTAVNAAQTAGVYLVVDEPVFGFDDVQLDYLVDGVVGWLTSGNIAKLLGSES